MAQPTADAVASRILTELASTRYACSSLTPLSGGTANFIYKAQLQEPLEDGTAEVVVKHGEGFAAQYSALKLPTFRCEIESECLQAVQKLTPTTADGFCVRTPRLLHFNAESTTQVQEYLPKALTLKAYALEHLSKTAVLPSVDPSEKANMVRLGRGLGKWLRSFHDWSAATEQDVLRAKARMNTGMQAIKLTYNYERLLWQLDKFPSILGPAKTIFTDVLAMAKAELEEEDKLQVIHGDFWTGNILLSDGDIRPDHQVTLSVIDYEMCQLSVQPLDLGQMIAELYELTLYKGIQAGLWIIEGLAAGYGYVDDEVAFRTALHVGVHLVSFGTTVAGWGEAEQVEKVAEVGRDVILRAWQKDESWFRNHDLEPIFRTDSS